MTSAQSKQMDTRGMILQKAVFLFAQTGYSGVSMRDIASAVGISAAALYHHFPDKHALYLNAVQHSFADKASRIREALETSGSTETRIARFISVLVRLIGDDPDFRRLLQRELLDGDEARLKMLATDIFEEQFKAISGLAEAIAPDCDAHMLALSIAGLVIHHFEMSPLRRFFPGSKPEHDEPDYIASHVTRLLLHGLKGMSRD